MEAYAAAGLANVPLLGSGLMADTHELDAHGASALGMRSALSWSEGIDTAENRSFMSAYRRANGKPADAFALLGYDTAAMIATAFGTMSREGGDLREALGSVTFTGPRGVVTVDPETRSIVTPLYLSQVRRTAGGPSNAIAATLDTTSGMRLDADGLASRQGWLNSYLSV
jgi:branched-chain amino acid transport system substrate-binding protein